MSNKPIGDATPTAGPSDQAATSPRPQHVGRDQGDRPQDKAHVGQEYLTTNFAMPEAEAYEWASVAQAIPLDCAAGWHQEGFSLQSAAPWVNALGLPDERAAVFFTAAGYNPQQATVLLQAYLATSRVSASGVIDVHEWLEQV